jgi:hypothetical protein
MALYPLLDRPAEVLKRPDGVRVDVLPDRDPLRVLVLLGCALVFGALAFSFVVDVAEEGTLRLRGGGRGGSAHIAFFGLFLAAYGTGVLGTLAWKLLGRETVEVAGGRLVRRIGLGPLLRSRSVPVAEIRGVRAVRLTRACKVEVETSNGARLSVGHGMSADTAARVERALAEAIREAGT